jgi:hypothetical protein
MADPDSKPITATELLRAAGLGLRPPAHEYACVGTRTLERRLPLAMAAELKSIERSLNKVA